MSPDALAPIGVIAHYNLLEALDASGFGELFRARDTRHGRTVALRLLPAGFTTNPPELVERIRSVQVLSHPNAITVFDVGEHDGRVYVVFEFLKGQSLRAEMAGRAVNPKRSVDMAIQIADAVADAHAAGFVHRGLSPDAVVITARGHAKIAAYDLAVQNGLVYADGQARLPDYDAPEEARGATPDDRSDVYSVGAILYEMLTMRRPMHRGASAPGATNHRVSRELDAVVLKAVAPNPDSRHQSVAALAAELRSVAAALSLDDGGATSRGEEAPAAATSMRGVVLTTAVILAALAAIVWWATRS
jgi:serine/threonine protein kinase